MNKIIIIGSTNNYNELGLVRSFGLNGIKPYGIIVCPQKQWKHDWLHLSKYWAKIIRVEDVDEAIKVLVANFGKDAEKPVVTSPMDIAVHAIDAKYDELSKMFHLQSINGQQDAINGLANKLEQAKLTAELGFKTLPTELLEMSDTVWPTIALPVLFKPVAGGEGHKDDITFCKTEDEVRTALEKFKKLNYKRILCQRYLENRTEIIAYGAMNKKTNLCSYTVLKNIRQWPPSYGVGSYGELVTDERILQFVKNLYTAVMEFGYNGPIDTDIFLDNDTQELYLSEYNWRPGGRNYTSIGTKVFSIVLWYYSVIGQDYSNMTVCNTRTGYTMNDGTDINHVLKKTLSFRNWYRDFKKADSHALWLKSDMKPAVYTFMAILKQWLKG